MVITHLCSGICSYSFLMTGAIFCETRPAIIIRSAWRGEPRNTSAPKRAMSKRDADMDIISMAQQAKPKLMGQSEDLRAQFTAWSSLVKMRPSCAEDCSVATSVFPIRLHYVTPLAGFQRGGAGSRPHVGSRLGPQYAFSATSVLSTSTRSARSISVDFVLRLF